MSMQVNETGRHVQSSNIDHFACLCGRNASGDRGDPAVTDRDVPNTVDLVFWIDDVSALQQQVKTRAAPSERLRRTAESANA
jgi:hypothetical protein